MASHSIKSNTQTSTQGTKLRKGRISIYTSTSIFWAIGENPTALRSGCALLRAGETLELKLPVNCSRLAVLAVSEPGSVVVREIQGGARASCSA